MFKFLHHKEVKVNQDIFKDIYAYEDVKKILASMLKARESIAVLLDGSPGTGKSMFLRDIQKEFPHSSRYIDGSRMTKAGLYKMLREDIHNSIKFLIIDEIDKLNFDDQEALLTLIEDGRVIQTQSNVTFTKKYEGLKVIAASNSKEDMLEPLLSRFYKVKVKDYTEEEFRDISRKILEKYPISDEVLEYIIEQVIQTKERPNLRDIVHIGKLCNNEIEMVDILIRNSIEEE